MFCTSCGAAIPTGSRFCCSCGSAAAAGKGKLSPLHIIMPVAGLLTGILIAVFRFA